MTLQTTPSAVRSQGEIPAHRASESRRFGLRPVMDFIRATWEGTAASGRGGSGDVRGALIAQTALALGIDRQCIYRWLHDGLGVYQADVIAIILGCHPVEIWPDWYELSVPTDEEIEASENAEAIERQRYKSEVQRRLRERRAAFEADPHAWRRKARPAAGDHANASVRYIAEGADQGEQVTRLLEVLGASK